MLQFPHWRNVFVEATQIFSSGCQDKLMLVVKGGRWSVVKCLIDELQSPEELCPPCSCPAHSQRTLALDRSLLVSVPRAWHPPPDHTESSLPTADPNYLRHDGLLINQMILSRGWWLLNGSNSIRKLCFFLLSILFAATSIIDLLSRVWIWMV